MLILSGLFAVLGTVSMAQDVRLVMIEQDGCIYCEQWNRDVGGEFPLTPEGIAAPLMRVDIDEMPSEGLNLARRAVFTPTFVLIRDGQELGRLEGYPGEDFFWGLLGRMLNEADVSFQ